jgi:colicin import membrane protein
MATEARAARDAARLETRRREQSEAAAAARMAELEAARKAAEDEAARMETKARNAAEVARMEAERSRNERVERKAAEEGTAKKVAELERAKAAAEREAARAAEKQAVAIQQAEEQARLATSDAARQAALEVARKEAEDAAARRKAAADAKKAAAEKERRDAAEAAAKARRFEERKERLRQGGRVAINVGMVVIVLAGVGFGAKFVGPAVGGALDSLRSLRTDAEEPGLEVSTPNAAPAAETSRASIRPVAPGPDRATLDNLDRLARETASAIRDYEVVADVFDPATGVCVDVQAVFVGVQDAWFDYSTSGTAGLTAPLDPTRAARDEDLYARVQGIERSYAETGCPRP